MRLEIMTSKTKLRPQYFYFDDFNTAWEFTENKNRKARVNQWIMVKNMKNGYTVYNIIRQNNNPVIWDTTKWENYTGKVNFMNNL